MGTGSRNLRGAAAAIGLALAAARAFGQAGPCDVTDVHTLCLDDGRFSVTVDFQVTPTGPSFKANAQRLTDLSGYFWFFDSENVELTVKVLNACVDPYNAYWFFAAGLTDVEVVITVRDLLRNEEHIYSSPLGTPFAPIQDTTTFRTCP